MDGDGEGGGALRTLLDERGVGREPFSQGDAEEGGAEAPARQCEVGQDHAAGARNSEGVVGRAVEGRGRHGEIGQGGVGQESGVEPGQLCEDRGVRVVLREVEVVDDHLPVQEGFPGQTARTARGERQLLQAHRVGHLLRRSRDRTPSTIGTVIPTDPQAQGGEEDGKVEGEGGGVRQVGGQGERPGSDRIREEGEGVVIHGAGARPVAGVPGDGFRGGVFVVARCRGRRHDDLHPEGLQCPHGVDGEVGIRGEGTGLVHDPGLVFAFVEMTADRNGASASEEQGEGGHLGVKVLLDLLDRTGELTRARDLMEKGRELAHERLLGRVVGRGVVVGGRDGEIRRKECPRCREPVVHDRSRAQKAPGDLQGGAVGRRPGKEEALQGIGGEPDPAAHPRPRGREGLDVLDRSPVRSVGKEAHRPGSAPPGGHDVPGREDGQHGVSHGKGGIGEVGPEPGGPAIGRDGGHCIHPVPDRGGPEGKDPVPARHRGHVAGGPPGHEEGGLPDPVEERVAGAVGGRSHRGDVPVDPTVVGAGKEDGVVGDHREEAEVQVPRSGGGQRNEGRTEEGGGRDLGGEEGGGPDTQVGENFDRGKGSGSLCGEEDPSREDVERGGTPWNLGDPRPVGPALVGDVERGRPTGGESDRPERPAHGESVPGDGRGQGDRRSGDCERDGGSPEKGEGRRRARGRVAPPRGRVRGATVIDGTGESFRVLAGDQERGGGSSLGGDGEELVRGNAGDGGDRKPREREIAAEGEVVGSRVVRPRHEIREEGGRSIGGKTADGGLSGRSVRNQGHPGVGGGDHDPGHPESHDGRLEGSRLPLPCRQDPLREIPRHRRPRGEPRSQSRQLIQQKGPEGEELREGVLGDTAQEGRGSQVQLLTIRVIEIKDITVNI